MGFLFLCISKIDFLVLCSENECIEIMGNYVFVVDDGNVYFEVGLVGLGVIVLFNYMVVVY